MQSWNIFKIKGKKCTLTSKNNKHEKKMEESTKSRCNARMSYITLDVLF